MSILLLTFRTYACNYEITSNYQFLYLQVSRKLMAYCSLCNSFPPRRRRKRESQMSDIPRDRDYIGTISFLVSIIKEIKTPCIGVTCLPLVITLVVLYCIVFIHFYSASHSMSLSEALPTKQLTL